MTYIVATSWSMIRYYNLKETTTTYTLKLSSAEMIIDVSNEHNKELEIKETEDDSLSVI